MHKRWLTALLLVGLLCGGSPLPGLASQEELQGALKLHEEVGQLYRAGRYQQALPLAHQALQIRYKNLGPEHPEVASSLTILGLLYQAKGSLEEALPLLDRALQIRYKTLGQDHPDTAASLNNLAELHRATGAWDKALPLVERALRTREKVLGPDHPDTAASLNTLAAYYQDRGEYEKARPLYERALASREKALPANHPDLAVSLNNLGELYRRLATFDRSLMMHERALQINERVFGSLHPTTALSLNNLATLYYDMGFYSKAQPLYEKALQIRQKTLGLEHLATAESLGNLAMLYQSQKEFDKARPLYERAMAIREKSLPEGHPAIAAGLSNLATFARDLGETAKALALFEQALRLREQALGPEHPETGASLGLLAAFHQDQGSPGKAIPLLQRVLKIKEQTLGVDHPQTIKSIYTLARAHLEAGQYNQALGLYTQAWKLREKALGPEHADTQASLNTLAALYFETGAYEKSQALYEQALKIKEKTPGPEHPDTAAGLNNLALVHQAQGDFAKALPLYERALKIQEAAANPEQAGLITTLINLAGMFRDMGAPDKALPLSERAVSLREKSLGPEHPDTAASLDHLAGLYLWLGMSEQAMPLFEKAWKILEKSKGASHLTTARALEKLAALQLARGEEDKAMPHYERVAAIYEKALGREHPETSRVLAKVGLSYAARQEQEIAAQYLGRVKAQAIQVDVALALGRFEEAWQLVEDTPPPPVSTPTFQINYHTQRGRALAGVGRFHEAAVAYWQAVQGLEKKSHRSVSQGPDLSLRSNYLGAYQGLVAVLTRLAHANAETPRELQEFGPDSQAAAFSLAEAAKARSLLAALPHISPNLLGVELPEELRQRRESLEFQLAANEAQWERAATGGKDGLQEAVARRQKLIGELAALSDELQLRQPLAAVLYYPQTVPVRHLPLAGNEVLISYSLGEDDGTIFVVRRDGVQYLYPLPMGRKELARRVRDFLTPLLNPQAGNFSLEKGRELYELLLAKPLATVDPDEPVIIVPEGILGWLPFEALVVEAGSDPATSIFVADRQSLTYYPAAGVLAQQRGRAPGPTTSPLLAVGDPVYLPKESGAGIDQAKKSAEAAPPRSAALGGATSARPAAAPTAPSPTALLIAKAARLHFPPLPGTEVLIREIAPLFGVAPEPPDVLLGRWASETHLRQAPLAEYRLVHFGVYTDLSGQTPGILEPFLALSQVENTPPDDGILTLSEILGLELGARLVTLSQGPRQGEGLLKGDGVINLARAFQYAGARSVLISLWESEPEVTRQFLKKVYGNLQAGKSPGAALRLARAALRQTHPEPVYWAGLILYGED